MRTALLPLLCLTACAETIERVPNQPGGNPINPAVALLPFPSDLYLAHDPATRTGRRVALPAAALPDGLDADDFSGADGFSRAQPIVAWLEGGFDPAALPANPEATLDPASPVLLVNGHTLAPVATLVELDQRAAGPEEQALLIRPLAALDPATPYAVIVRAALPRADGAAHARPEAVRALVDGVRTEVDAIEAQREDFSLVHDALDALAIPPDEVLLAWTFHTRSREDVVGPVLSLHRAMAEAPLTWTVDSDAIDGDDRLVRGRITVPWFLDERDRLAVDAEGEVVAQGSYDMPFQLTIPDTVTETRPVFVFGHGFFASLAEPEWSLLNPSLHAWRISAASTNFIGFDEEHQLETFGRIGGDLGELHAVVAQQLQSHGHHTALARALREGLAASITEGEVPLLDASDLAYMGISNGGTQGAVICAATDAFSRCGLVVGGGAWSTLVQRAVQFDTMGAILTERYPDPRELQVVLSLMQLAFDPVDAMNHADRLVRDRADGREDVVVGLFEALHDSQVSNVVTHMVARSADAALITPAPVDVWGLRTATAAPPGTDEPVALMIWSDDVAPSPEGNLSPPEDNGIHEDLRRMPTYQAAMQAFLVDGTVVQACDGACDPG